MKQVYLETILLIERLHRRFLDVVKSELDRLKVEDINNVQTLILYNIGGDQLTVGELTNRGYYLGTNVSYNVKHLVQTEYLIQEKAPWLNIDGEMHGDVALDSKARAALMPNSDLIGDANLLVLPNIDAANISYNLLKTAAGGNIAIGPVLLGAAQPVHILTASTTVRRIVNMTALTVADANASR